MPYAKVGPWANGAPPALSAVNLDQLETQYDEAVADIPPVVWKTADEDVNNSAVLQNDDELLYAIGANEDAYIEILAHIHQQVASAQFKWSITVPALATIVAFSVGDDSGTPRADTIVASGAAGIIQIGNAVHTILVIKVLVLNGVNAGNIQLQWAQNVAQVGNTTVKEGSILIAHKVE